MKDLTYKDLEEAYNQVNSGIDALGLLYIDVPELGVCALSKGELTVNGNVATDNDWYQLRKFLALRKN
jgi:hypothetical protein